MKLLFDQNLSRHLPGLLRDIFPDSLHVRNLEMRQIRDSRIWQYAKEHDYLIVTKDTDFRDMSDTLGSPPKVVLIVLPNGPTPEVVSLLQERFGDILELYQDESRAFLELP